jgi:GNAT superfamily N-acetyltransferase
VADVSVRPARPADAERVAEVQLHTWRQAYADVLPAAALAVPQADVAAVWRRGVELPPTPRHRLLVAVDGEDVVGFAASAPADDEDVDPRVVSELTAVLVEPRWGRRGHGSRLLAATVDLWRRDATQTGITWVWEADAASQGFLRSAGWETDGTARGLDTGPRVQRQVRMQTSLEDA